MHILYVDEASHAGDSGEEHVVLGGIAVFERGLYHAIKAVDECVGAYGIGAVDDIELNGHRIVSGDEGVWRSVREQPRREQMLRDALSTFASAASVRLFGAAVEKAGVTPDDPVQIAFEEVCSRFNMFLQRNRNKTGEEHKGLVVVNGSKDASRLQAVAGRFRANAGRWGALKSLAEVPLSVDAKASRLMQLADLVAYATWQKYEQQDGRFFDALIPKFDSDAGFIQGLAHRPGARDCPCPACRDKRW